MQKETHKATKPMEKADNYTSGKSEAFTEKKKREKDFEREKLEEAFCHKISEELEGFKEEALKLEREEIFSIAYRIDSMICIYETLAEHSGELGEEELKRWVQEEGILQPLYQRWLKSPAPQEELEHSVCSGIKEICRDAESEAGETIREKKQKLLETEEKTARTKQKISVGQRGTGTKRKREPQKKNGTLRKDRFHGKADSDQKPAA